MEEKRIMHVIYSFDFYIILWIKYLIKKGGGKKKIYLKLGQST